MTARRLSNKICQACGKAYSGSAQSRYCGDACLLKRAITVDEDGCWMWPKSRSNGRYGIARAGSVPTVMAHRLSHETFVGPVGDKMVLHRCDKPLCINPEHLFLGSAADNTADMMKKRRHAHGEKSPRAKLSEEQAVAIWRDERSWQKIATAFGVSKGAVMLIKTRRSWAHIHARLM